MKRFGKSTPDNPLTDVGQKEFRQTFTFLFSRSVSHSASCSISSPALDYADYRDKYLSNWGDSLFLGKTLQSKARWCQALLQNLNYSETPGAVSIGWLDSTYGYLSDTISSWVEQLNDCILRGLGTTYG